jgi:SsrA-binding protein
VLQLHIPPYEQGNRWNRDPLRKRKLLLHRAEIAKLKEAVTRKGLTIVPLKLYFSRGNAKLLIGVAKGKKTYDKRHAIAERDAKREMDRARGARGTVVRRSGRRRDAGADG